jgi:hypothetical protein
MGSCGGGQLLQHLLVLRHERLQRHLLVRGALWRGRGEAAAASVSTARQQRDVQRQWRPSRTLLQSSSHHAPVLPCPTWRLAPCCTRTSALDGGPSPVHGVCRRAAPGRVNGLAWPGVWMANRHRAVAVWRCGDVARHKQKQHTLAAARHEQLVRSGSCASTGPRPPQRLAPSPRACLAAALPWCPQRCPARPPCWPAWPPGIAPWPGTPAAGSAGPAAGLRSGAAATTPSAPGSAPAPGSPACWGSVRGTRLSCRLCRPAAYLGPPGLALGGVLLLPRLQQVLDDLQVRLQGVRHRSETAACAPVPERPCYGASPRRPECRCRTPAAAAPASPPACPPAGARG